MSIELPVDIGENTLKYSTPERLQESFVAVIEYLMTSEHSPQEWIEFLSLENYQTLILLAQSSARLVELEIEELDENQTKQNKEEDNDEETEETEETVDHYSKASALSLLCQILVMFGSLNVSKFCPIIMEHAYENILSSIKYHQNITRFDTVNRLKLIEFIAVHNKKINIEPVYIEILCEMLESEYTDVIETASSSIIYSVGRGRKSHIKSLLELIESKLSSDTFRHFTQFYFELLNGLDYANITDDTLELLITFNSNVFKWNLDSFYFTSDIKVLIDIYIRAFHNISPSSKPLLLCLDGVYNIIRWKQYVNTDKLNQYKSDQLIEELNELTKIVETASNEFKQYENKENEEYTQEQLIDILKLIEKIENKINVIKDTLMAIKNGEYDYDAAIDEIIKLPIDISQYALDTKSMNILQCELMELLQYLSESTNTPKEWIDFLSEDEYEIYNRLCLLSNRLLMKENKNDDDEEEENKNDDDDGDELDDELLYPLSALCQLLATFASLKPSEFAIILKENVFKNIINSFSNHDKLNSDDVTVRLQTIIFMITNIDGIFEYNHDDNDDNDDDMWFYKILVNLLLSEYEPVLIMTTKCISFYIGKLGENNREKQKKYLLFLQNTLKDDDFRHFTEHFFAICNEAEWDHDDIQTKLLIDFVNCCMENELNDFFFSSDLKVLIDIYERTLHNINIDGLTINWLISGIQTLFKWNRYENELNRYHYNELCIEIKSCINNAIENQLFHIAAKLDPLLRIIHQ